MENLSEKNLWKIAALSALLFLAVLIGRCTSPTPQPVVFTEVNTEYVEVEVETIKYLTRNADHECLAQAVYAEARGEPELGQLKVAQIIMNRVEDRRFPNTICEVVNQKVGGTRQFSYLYTNDPSFYKTARVFSNMRTTQAERKARQKAYEIADKIMAGERVLPRNSLNYHANYVRPPWASNLQEHSKVGAHVFYTGY